MKIRHLGLIGTAVLVVFLSASPAPGQQDDQAALALKAAIKTETVDGDLRSAIEQYKKIVALPGADRATIATALLRMGECHEKLGDTNIREARQAYEQVVREYADQAAVAAEARAKLAGLVAGGGGTASSTLTVRRVWAHANVTGKVSADGRFLSFGGYNVGVHDLASGQNRLLTGAGLGGSKGIAEPSMLSPDGKSVAYAWYSNDSRDLCVVGLDGSRPRTLAKAGNGVLYSLPVAWSPDSKHVLAEFVRTDGSIDMMLVAVADGSKKLLKAVGRNQSPGGEFSPDGRYIAWADQEGISLFDLRTRAESRLIQDRPNPRVLGWAPDGKHVLFSSERAGSSDAWLVAVANGKAQGESVLVRKNWGNMPMGFTRSGAFYYAVINNIWDTRIADLDADGGGMVSSPRPAFRRGNTRAAEWSPDGGRLAAIDAHEPRRAVIVRSMDTGEERELRIGERTIMNGGLRWTPDGKAVVVPASEPGKGDGLIRIDVQSGQVTSLMPLPALSGWPRFELSRDGQMIFYLRPPGRAEVESSCLVSHELRSGRETEVFRDPSLYWGGPTPDGRHVVIAVNSEKSWALLVRPVSGGESRELVRVDKEKQFPHYGSPSLTSDGRFIFFLKGDQGGGANGGYPKEWQLWRVAVEGGEPQPIARITAQKLQGVRVHPGGRRIAVNDLKVDLEVWVMENFLPPSNAEK